MNAYLLHITFEPQLPAEEYARACDEVAQAVASSPGLRWKLWLTNGPGGEAGGFYAFEDAASRAAYLDGPIVAQLRTTPVFKNLKLRTYEVLTGPTGVTRGPV